MRVLTCLNLIRKMVGETRQRRTIKVREEEAETVKYVPLENFFDNNVSILLLNECRGEGDLD